MSEKHEPWWRKEVFHSEWASSIPHRFVGWKMTHISNHQAAFRMGSPKQRNVQVWNVMRVGRFLSNGGFLGVAQVGAVSTVFLGAISTIRMGALWHWESHYSAPRMWTAVWLTEYLSQLSCMKNHPKIGTAWGDRSTSEVGPTLGGAMWRCWTDECDSSGFFLPLWSRLLWDFYEWGLGEWSQCSLISG